MSASRRLTKLQSKILARLGTLRSEDRTEVISVKPATLEALKRKGFLQASAVGLVRPADLTDQALALPWMPEDFCCTSCEDLEIADIYTQERALSQRRFP